MKSAGTCPAVTQTTRVSITYASTHWTAAASIHHFTVSQFLGPHIWERCGSCKPVFSSLDVAFLFICFNSIQAAKMWQCVQRSNPLQQAVAMGMAEVPASCILEAWEMLYSTSKESEGAVSIYLQILINIVITINNNCNNNSIVVISERKGSVWWWRFLLPFPHAGD